MENSFRKGATPIEEKERLETLRSYQILDSEPEPFFDNLAQIMAQCFKTPIALISLVDEEKVFFKANVGIEDTRHISRGISLCSLAIQKAQPLVFKNTLTEPCLLSNPLVAGEFGMRFYAGAPIISPNGYRIGTACVVDKKPREFDEMDRELLARFAQSVMKAIIQREKSLRNTASS